MTTTKPAGWPCPKCLGTCAEYALMGAPMRWICNACGASGEIARTTPVPVAPVKPVHPHWSERRA